MSDCLRRASALESPHQYRPTRIKGRPRDPSDGWPSKSPGWNTLQIGNFTHVYGNVNIEGGRPAEVGSSTAEVPDRSVIGDGCWINHGTTMHRTQIGGGGAVGLNACCDYNTRIGKGAILVNASATHVDQVIPESSFAEGVPAVIKKRNITDDGRRDHFGLLPAG